MLTLEPALLSDLEALAELRATAMRESLERIGRFDPERARARLVDGYSPEFTRHVAVHGERVGVLVLRPKDGDLLLDHLYFWPAHQGKGYGSWVLSRVFAEADATGFA